VSRIFAAIGRFSIKFRYVMVVFWIGITVLCVAVLPTLASVTKDTQSGFLPSSSPSIQAADMLTPFVNPNYATMTLVAATTDKQPLTSDDLTAIQKVTAEIAQMRAQGVRVVTNNGASPDQQAVRVDIQAAVPPYGGGGGPDLVTSIRGLFASSGAPSTLQMNLTGQLPSIVDAQNAQHGTQSMTEALSIALIVVLLFFAYRALLAPLITILVPALVLLLSQPVIAEATKIGVQSSSVTPLMLVVLILGAGTDYGLFLVFRAREELRGGATPHQAIITAVETVGESITFSALIVIVALTSLVTASFGFYQSMGPSLAIGIALMLLAALTLLPAALAIAGRAVYWPTQTKTREQHLAGRWSRLTGWLLRKPLVTAVAGIIICIAVASAQLGVPAAGFADTNAGPAGADSTKGTQLLAQHFPSSANVPTSAIFTFGQSVWADPASLITLQNDLSNNAQFVNVVGPVPTKPGQKLNLSPQQDAPILAALYERIGPPQSLPIVPTESSLITLQSMFGATLNLRPLPDAAAAATLHSVYDLYHATAAFIAPDGKTVQLYVQTHNDSAEQPDAIANVPNVRAAVNSVARQVGAVSNGLYGLQPFAYDVSNISQQDLKQILPMVAILIGILLGLVMRSVVAPLFLVPSVLLSYLAALGLTAILFVHIGGQSGLQFILPFLMFVFLMALGSDYNVLVMTRIREEAHKLRLREAVTMAIGATGTTVTSAGVILGGTFAVLALSANGTTSANQVQQIGFGIAVGVVLDTFVVRTILVPAICVLVGRWTWWPSAMFRHPVAMGKEDR
jgi:putative drug exporter of the RND superfamily